MFVLLFVCFTHSLNVLRVESMQILLPKDISDEGAVNEVPTVDVLDGVSAVTLSGTREVSV